MSNIASTPGHKLCQEEVKYPNGKCSCNCPCPGCVGAKKARSK